MTWDFDPSASSGSRIVFDNADSGRNVAEVFGDDDKTIATRCTLIAAAPEMHALLVECRAVFHNDGYRVSRDRIDTLLKKMETER